MAQSTDNLNASVDDSPIIKEGWLRPRGRGRDRGRSFCEVRREALVIRDQSDANKEDRIPLSASTRVHVISKSEFSLIPQSGQPQCFKVPHRAALPDWVLKLRRAACQCTDLSMDSFQIISVLGRGYYGKVMLCQRINTTKLYAIKSVHKSRINTPERLSAIFQEKEVLCALNHPFIVQLAFCFDTSAKVYFGMQYVPGGELSMVVEERELSLSDVQLYVAQIALALRHIHQNHIIYRDLKTRNILLDEQGYLKLIDFGLAHRCKPNEIVTAFCGTPEYVAPEMIRKKRYDYAVDWWALGILTFELLTGRSPFRRATNFKTYQAIVNEEPRYKEMDPVAKDFISCLLMKDPEERMVGSDVLEHEFLEGIDFVALLNRQIKMPFIPEVINGIGTRAKSCESAADSRAEMPECDPTAFNGFSFTNDDVMVTDAEHVALDLELPAVALDSTSKSGTC